MLRVKGEGHIETQDQMVITLSFSWSKEGVSRVYFVKIWKQDIRYNIFTRAETIQEGMIRYTIRYRGCDTIRDTIRFQKGKSRDKFLQICLKSKSDTKTALVLWPFTVFNMWFPIDVLYI